MIEDGREHDLLRRLFSARERTKHPDWDGEGASPMQPETVALAAAFLRALPADVPAPDIAVDPDGVAYIEWDCDQHNVFTVAVSADGSMSFAGLAAGAPFHGAEPLRLQIPGVVLDGIARVLAGRTVAENT